MELNRNNTNRVIVTEALQTGYISANFDRCETGGDQNGRMGPALIQSDSPAILFEAGMLPSRIRAIDWLKLLLAAFRVISAALPAFARAFQAAQSFSFCPSFRK
jgi:hypothetical protein